MNGLFIVGVACLIGGAIGILMNFRMTSSRPNPVFAFGNVLFFIGPIVLGIRSIVHSVNQVEYFAFGFAAVGLLVMSIGLILGRRRNRI
jgi:FtsH-binding integral membrane protein